MNNSLEQYPEHRYAVLLWQYFPPLFIFIGTCGNLLTITVLMQRKNRNTPTAVYLTALASSDLIVLWSPLLTQWVHYTFDVDFLSLSQSQCKIFFFLSYIALQFSSLMIVAVTSERAISVLLPHKVKYKCRPRNAVAVSITIVVSLLIVNIHWLFGVGVKTIYVYKSNISTEKYECRPLTEGSKYFIEVFWPWIDLSIFYLIPLLVLLAGSAAIIISLRINKHKRQNQIAPAVTNVNSNTLTSRNKMSHQLTKMLITVDIVFFICTTPATIYMTIFPDALSAPEQSRHLAVHELWWAVVNMLMFLNNTANFILYFLSGSRFRNEVKNLLCRKQTRAIFTTAQSNINQRDEVGMNKGPSSADVNLYTRDKRAPLEPRAGTSIECITSNQEKQ